MHLNVKSFSTLKKTTYFPLFFLWCLALLGIVSAGGTAVHALERVPLAGTAIKNRATVQYYDPGMSGYPVTIQSNEVSVTVLPVEALTLTKDRTVTLPPGAPASLAHRLTNTGNTPTDYHVVVENLTGDDYDLINLRLVRDLDGNGVPDSGEPEFGPGDTIRLQPGESADFVVTGIIPTATAAGSSSQVRITATSVSQTKTASNTDTILVTDGVATRLFKEVDKEKAKDKDLLTYSLTAFNIGTGLPQTYPVKVDGATEQLIIVRDRIPANTVFVATTGQPSVGKWLYHLHGESDPDSYTVNPPADKSKIDAIAYGIGQWQQDNLQVKISFQVRITSPTAGTIINSGEFRYIDPDIPSVPHVKESNPVHTVLDRVPPTIYYYTDDTYDNLATSTTLGTPLYLQVSAASCNIDPLVKERIWITIVSRDTGDSLKVEMEETGPNTGIFRPIDPNPILTRDVAEHPVDRGNPFMETQKRDSLRATIEDCAGQTAYAEIIVSPSGVVFDARTNEEISGAVVTVYPDGMTASIASYTTGSDGAFEFPNLPPGDYVLVVTPPAGSLWEFPSNVPLSLLPLNRKAVIDGSYGKRFTIPVNGALDFDIPLDSGPPSGLFLEKQASHSVVEIGDFLEYRLRIENRTGVEMADVIVEDTLPRGFALVKGSVRRIDSGVTTRMADPAGTPGPHLVFNLNDLTRSLNPHTEDHPDHNDTTPGNLRDRLWGTIDVGGVVEIVYRVRVTSTARPGTAINRAHVRGHSAYGVTESNVSAARVYVQSGVLNTRGIIIGKVFVDRNDNRIQDPGEEGIPGVRLWLENGTYVVTDSEGKYSIYGLSPGTHVVKLDTTTMPAGSQLSPITFKHTRSGSSSFADLRMGGMVKVNFAIREPSDDVLEVVAARREKAKTQGTSLDSVFNTTLRQFTQEQPNRGTRGLAASGVVNSTASGNRGQSFTLDNVPTTGLASSSVPSSSLFGDSTTGKSLGGSFGSSLLGRSSLGDAESLFAPGSSGLALGSGTLSGTGAQGEVFPKSKKASDKNKKDVAAPAPRDGRTPEELLPTGAPNQRVKEPIGAGNSNLPPTPVRVVPRVPLESSLDGLTNELAFLDLRDGDTLPINQTNVRVKGAAGAKMVLRVNGKEVPENRIGKKSTLAETQLEAREYIGVGLEAGENTLELGQYDVGGNLRESVSVRVIAPGTLGQLQVFTRNKTAYADGRTPVMVGVQLLDKDGVPVTSRTPLTLEASVGSWQVADLNPLEPGVQVFLEGGRGEFPLLPPMEAGESVIRITSGVLGASVRLSFIPDLRPMVAAGVLEGRLSAFSVKRAEERSTESIFEEQLRSIASTGKAELEGRGALFLKGRVQGKYLLTLRYDSQRDDEDERLFRDIQPDEFYPIYGDSSLRGFDAQSNSRLYLRVDKNKSYVLYGDYTTPTQNLARALGEYNRSLTGAKVHHETGRFSLNAFASRDSTRQIVDEIPANGTSGPYLLRGGYAVRNSEKVELIVRDRNQPSVILRIEPQTRFSDYQIDGLTEGILFRAPIPSRDANLNPIFIRVTYEVESGGPNFFIGGFDGQFRVGNRLVLGGSVVEDRDPADPFRMRSLNALYRLAPNTLLILEGATTERDSIGRGNAGRLEVLHESSRLQARLLLARTGEKFSNLSSALSSGREEFSLRTAYRLNRRQRLIAEAIRTHDIETDGTRQGALFSLEQTLSSGVRLEVGMRHAKERGTSPSLTGEDVDFTSLRARLTGQVPRMPLTLFTEYEHAFSGKGQALSVGGEYQIANRSRVYFLHDFIDSLAGRYALNDGQRNNTTVFGVDTDYMRNGRVFSEYRIRDSIDGRSAEAAIGLRNVWNVGRGVRLGTSFERIKNVGGDAPTVNGNSVLGEGTAGSLAVEYLPRENLKATGRFEARRGERENSYLSTLGVAYKANEDWTFLARTVFAKRDRKDTSSNTSVFDDYGRTQARLQLGAAWRQTERDKWNGLAKYEYRTDSDGESFGNRFKRRAHILSFDLNNQLNARTEWGLHYAWKKSLADGGGFSSSGSAHLLSTRVTREFRRRYEASLLAGALWDGRGGRGVQTGLGAELSYMVTRDMSLGIGYSFLGVRDRDLGLDFDRRGPYIRWRWKFDENLFRGGPRSEIDLAAAGTVGAPTVKREADLKIVESAAAKGEDKDKAKAETKTAAASSPIVLVDVLEDSEDGDIGRINLSIPLAPFTSVPLPFDAPSETGEVLTDEEIEQMQKNGDGKSK